MWENLSIKSHRLSLMCFEMCDILSWNDSRIDAGGTFYEKNNNDVDGMYISNWYAIECFGSNKII